MGSNDAESGEFVMLSVSDTGIGMSSQTLEHAIEPFFTTKGVGEGSGLGLSMVYGFVNQSGGQFAIESVLNAGATIKIYLPRTSASDEPAPHVKDTQIVRSRGEKVRVVEDDPDVRDLSVRLLSDLGYETAEAGAGAEAIRILESSADFDLLFTDVVLPGGMDGMAIANQAKRQFPGIKVLYTSGAPNPSSINTASWIKISGLSTNPIARTSWRERFAPCWTMYRTRSLFGLSEAAPAGGAFPVGQDYSPVIKFARTCR
jgi:CheY-like chemotaxis protein